jgi:hypothetical protein
MTTAKGFFEIIFSAVLKTQDYIQKCNEVSIGSSDQLEKPFCSSQAKPVKTIKDNPHSPPS